MNWMRRMTEYLGLAPDDEYDEYDEYEEDDDRDRDQRDERTTGQNRAVRGPAAPTGRVMAVPSHEPERSASVRTLPVTPVRPAGVDDDRDRVTARPQHTGPVVVRPAVEQPAVAKPLVVSPTSFAGAQDVADKFKANRPVIMNLQGLDRDLRRRLIDFASGLCYGLGGKLDKAADQVFLLTPADVQVPEEDRRRLSERDFDDAR